MKIGLAQIKPEAGNLKANLEKHLRWIDLAIAHKVDLIAFPELSISGYEPHLAKHLATDADDPRLEDLQQKSNDHNVTIVAGLPTRSKEAVLISAVIFQPFQDWKNYSKQQLHEDERPFFIPGNEQITFEIENKKIAPAICYEALQPAHIANAVSLKANIYLATVAKSHTGVEKAKVYYPEIAKKYAMQIVMVNCVGFCDNFESAGQSAVWNRDGRLIAQLGRDKEGLLIFDTNNEPVTTSILSNPTENLV